MLNKTEHFIIQRIACLIHQNIGIGTLPLHMLVLWLAQLLRPLQCLNLCISDVRTESVILQHRS